MNTLITNKGDIVIRLNEKEEFNNLILALEFIDYIASNSKPEDTDDTFKAMTAFVKDLHAQLKRL